MMTNVKSHCISQRMHRNVIYFYKIFFWSYLVIALNYNLIDAADAADATWLREVLPISNKHVRNDQQNLPFYAQTAILDF